MAVKKCCIENCNSSSTRSEDIGVTFHKFPKETTLRGMWVLVTQCVQNNIDSLTYVCSRHFCKSDFQMYQDTKYVLKSDAVPSIFSWTIKNKTNTIMDSLNTSDDSNIDEKSDSRILPVRKMSDGENVEAIKRYIEKQEREIQEFENQRNQMINCKTEVINGKGTNDNKTKYSHENINGNDFKDRTCKGTMDVIEQGEKVVIATSMIDMILMEKEAQNENFDMKQSKQHLSSRDKGISSTSSSMALSVGSKVEAKDFSDSWYPASIIEVDYDEMEVLVHYENISNKHDEWISVNSPRLRPYTKISTPILPSTSEMDVKEEKQDNKLKYVIGERCLARWRDNRRFIATVCVDFGDGNYEVMFDDGAKWKCPLSRMYKLKESKSELTIDTSMSPTPSTPSPTLIEAGPSSGSNPNINLALPYHKHLFDPTRDYLGSKSERREMKRKLNIKEIFNIGQKKQKTNKTPSDKVKVLKEKKPRMSKKQIQFPVEHAKIEVKTEIPDAVASIIGTVDSVKNEGEAPQSLEMKQESIPEEMPMKVPEEMNEETPEKVVNNEEYEEVRIDPNGELIEEESVDSMVDNSLVDTHLVVPSDLGFEKPKEYENLVIEEETKLEKFEKPDESKQEVIEKMKEVINKLEDGLKVHSSKPELIIKLEQIKYDIKQEVKVEKSKGKVKKNKKLRLIQEKKVKKQVEKVKSELEEMKRQVEEMKKQMLMKTEELSMARPLEMPESFLLPGEWCCKWVNGEPVGTESEIDVDKQGLPRKSVQVEDKRLPPGWTKHLLRRSLGLTAGKWDVVLIAPDNRRFHTKTDMKNYLEQLKDDSLKPYESALTDFGVHLKLSRRMRWCQSDKDKIVDMDSNLSPLTKTKKLTIKREKKEKRRKKAKVTKENVSRNEMPGTSAQAIMDVEPGILEDGYVYVGSLKVQIIDTLLRCPAEGCLKNFRNNTLLQMHIKHYHRELRKMLGATPKVLDLAQERKPTDIELKRYEPESKIIKVKIARPPKKIEEPKPEIKETAPEIEIDIPVTKPESVPRSQDSPKLRQALVNKPVKRPKVLLPVRRPEPEPEPEPAPKKEEVMEFDEIGFDTFETPLEALDFEAEISTHTVTKPLDDRKRIEKKFPCASTSTKLPISEDDEWFGMNSDVETRSSYPGSATPDSKTMDKPIGPQAMSSESNEEPKENMYMFTETGERVKIEHMKREEIINCHCGFREEDGLMVQCELCLCWQHALCHNIQRESEVPEKYTCSICLNPRRGRRSKRFLHDQDRLYEGLLPGAKPCESLRRSHELSGNLLRIQDALHALRVKYHVATKQDHPKLYLWAKDWETAEIGYTQERLNSDYSDLNIIINNIGKENLPVRPEEVRDAHLDMRTPITEESDHDRYTQRDGPFLGSSTALSSPSGTSLDLPITTSELERLAKSVQEQEAQRCVTAPQPEAAIENSACRERLLRHVQRCQALIDARLDSIEAQVAELESQDPSFEDDETADYFPRTKQTVQMLMRDLDTMEELGIIT